MGAACDQHNVAAGQLQECADASADAARSIDDVSHVDVLSLNSDAWLIKQISRARPFDLAANRVRGYSESSV